MADPTPTLDQEDFFSAVLVDDISDSDTVIPLDVVPTVVTEGYLTISRKSVTLREVIYFTSVDTLNKTVTCPASGGRGVAGTAQSHQAGETVAMTNNSDYWQSLKNGLSFLDGVINHRRNVLQNGNFINASTNGYGGVPDDWTNSSLGNAIQGGHPVLTKQLVMDVLGVATGVIEALYPLNAANGFDDLSDSNYDLSASGSPTDGFSCPLDQCKDFELSSSQYASVATPTNALITGNQSWFAMVKPESIPATGMTIFGHSDNTPTVYLQLIVEATTGIAAFEVIGLSTATIVRSPVKLEAGKWYFICGIYDSSNSLLKIWVNGVKAQTTASGSHTITGTQSLAIGRLGAFAGNYFDGMIQNCGVLSTALTDDQYKRLWSALTYKGIKCGRSGSDGYIYQSLPQDLVERLRGRKLTLRASMYQDVASIGQISIYDGSETVSDTDSTANSWLDKKVTKTVSSTATEITVRLKVSTTNGNVWFKEVALYEGAIALPYEHSQFDWSRFPRLLRLSPPAVISGYQFEEGRWFSYSPGGVAASNVTVTGRGITFGKNAISEIYLVFTGAITFTTMPRLFCVAGAGIIGPSNETQMSGVGGYTDTGTADVPNGIFPAVNPTETTCVIRRGSDGAQLSATVPVTWANGDKAKVVTNPYDID